MKNLLKLEELAMFIFGTWYFISRGFGWGWYLGLILTPDLGMLGYLVNDRAGALTYNLFHHKGVALVVFALGLMFPSQVLQMAGIILFTHSSMDRIFGYGLKYENGFSFTHLGKIGKEA
jgi:hypothetical protein